MATMKARKARIRARRRGLVLELLMFSSVGEAASSQDAATTGHDCSSRRGHQPRRTSAPHGAEQSLARAEQIVDLTGHPIPQSLVGVLALHLRVRLATQLVPDVIHFGAVLARQGLHNDVAAGKIHL